MRRAREDLIVNVCRFLISVIPLMYKGRTTNKNLSERSRIMILRSKNTKLTTNFSWFLFRSDLLVEMTVENLTRLIKVGIDGLAVMNSWLEWIEIWL